MCEMSRLVSRLLFLLSILSFLSLFHFFGVRLDSTRRDRIFEPQHDKTNKMTYTNAPSEDADQPGHPPSLIRAFAVRMKKHWVLSYWLSVQRRLISLGGCPGWSESSLGAQVILFVLSCWSSFYFIPGNHRARIFPRESANQIHCYTIGLGLILS